MSPANLNASVKAASACKTNTHAPMEVVFRPGTNAMATWTAPMAPTKRNVVCILLAPDAYLRGGHLC